MRTLLRFICLSFVVPALNLSAQKNIKSLNDGWSFRRTGNAAWTSVAVPHTYNEDAYRTRDYYRGKAEYFLNLKMPEIDSSRRYFIKFGAVNKAAGVRLNDAPVVEHAGGYAAFCSDITPYLRAGDNALCVTVDNARDDIAPVSADFTFWGGIYRDVWLISTSLQHFDLGDSASSGVYITPTNVSGQSATLSVRSRIKNDAKTPADIKLVLSLKDDSGKTVSSMARKLRLKPGETVDTIVDMPELRNPSLWSPESPYLYTLTASIVSAKSGATLDSTSIPTGLRWFSFDGPEGFKLNGKHYKLRGINRHQDMAPLGVALDDEAHRRDMRLLKDLGCNFVRLAHYQQDDAVLDECDRLGLIVWEEIPTVNIVPDIPGFGDNCETALVEMIRQHYNHPSVMLWGYMNEILLKAPAEHSDEWPAAKARSIALARRLESRLKEEDLGRASVMAFHGSDRYNAVGLDISDVQGWNLYQGWYGGDLSGFERFLEEQRARYPGRSLIVSEWGAGSDWRLHSDSPVPFDFSMEYQQRYIEHYLPYIEKSDYISGGAYWNFIDFNVAERQESMPRCNNKGLFYNDRTPKDVAYYFKSMWRKDVPVVHIAVRDRDMFVRRDSTTTIKVYSNCPEVELEVDGQSYGIEKTSNCSALFDVDVVGENVTLTAKGVLDGTECVDVATISCDALPDIMRGETLAINVGSNCDFTSSINGQTWLADRPYQIGMWGYVDGKKRSTTAEIFNTHDTPLFQTMLEGVTDYRIDAPAGRYEVELLFADVSRSGNNSPYLLGRDIENSADENSVRMSVIICGRPVEPEFVPSGTERYQHAVRRKYIVDNTTGVIGISFVPLSGTTVLSGIAIRRTYSN